MSTADKPSYSTMGTRQMLNDKPHFENVTN